MNATKMTLLFITAGVLVFTGCGKNDPDVITENYYPMAVENYWEYIETYSGDDHTETAIHEVTGTETIDFGGELGERTVFVIENTFGFTSTDSRTYYIEDDGDKLTRLRQTTNDVTGNIIKIGNYFPGLLKFDRTRVIKGETWDESTTQHTYDEDGNETGITLFHYTFTITNLHVEVTVPAGTFDCITFTREITPPLSYETKTYYYAPGVGKVKEISEEQHGNKTEELTSYTVGGLD